MVHEALRSVALGRLHQNQARNISALLTCVALLAGCGSEGDSDNSKERADNLPQPTLPVALRHAECSDWRKGSVEERQGTVAQIREFARNLGGSSQRIEPNRVLPDSQAYTVLDRSCRQRYARGFRLYLLYTRAASFAGRSGAAGSLATPPG